jgi:hypothetical protein
MQRRQLNRLVPGTIRLVGVGTGVEPATSRSIIWCSAFELTNVDVPWSDPIHGTGSAKPSRATCMPLDRKHQRPSIQRDAGGSRTHFDRVAADCLALWLQRLISHYRVPAFILSHGRWRNLIVLARNRTWSSTFAKSRANPAHSENP